MDEILKKEFNKLFGDDPVAKILLDGEGYTSNGRLNQSKCKRLLGIEQTEFLQKLQILKIKLRKGGYDIDAIQ